MNINKEISSYFLTDARDYLSRYQVLKERATHIGLRSKLLLELLFALECSLKSIIFFESLDDEKTTYKKIQSHDLNKLSKLLSDFSRREYVGIITEDLNHFKVSIRYQLESEINFRTENGILENKYYETIVNFSWLDSRYSQISDFIKYIDSLNPVKINTIQYEDINPDNEIMRYTILRNLKNR